ncbi:MAG: LicD family protein [Ruminococcus sp.]|nr:LicD family protein [Ruminococcus sp.]
MNELQKKEFEILKLFIDVCNKLNLTYFLVCGSALGAVKYGGFIPWDDDIDVALMRPDYETFLREAPALLPEWLFVQNYRTEKNFPLLMTKLRDSRTTMIESDFADVLMNHGISIDVFSLDGYPNDSKEAIRFENKKKCFTRRQFARLNGKRMTWGLNVRTTLICLYYRLFGFAKETSRLMGEYDSFLASYSLQDSTLICNHGNWQGKLEYAPAEQYGIGTMASFEGLSVRIPADYDAYLRQKYGDYSKDPPKEKQVSHHSYKVIDVTRPYTEYIK